MNPHNARAFKLARQTPHTFTIQYPPSRAYFQQRFQRPEIKDATPWLLSDLAERHHALLYVHVPFCAQRCFYCNFAVDLRKNEDLHQRYIKALTTQSARLLERWPSHTKLKGIDIGGGTPTQIHINLLETLMRALQPWMSRCTPDAQCSIETTPRVAAHEPDKLALLHNHGIQRVSIGIQSTNDETLKHVNRRQQRSLAQQALHNLTHAGFERVSVDLVFGLPDQSTEAFLQDLDRVIGSGVDAITIYDCLYRGEGRILPGLSGEMRPEVAHYHRMYDAAFERLTTSGFHGQYGGVNFSRHPDEYGTSSYFTHRLLHGQTYVGLGNYASSLTREGKWWFAPYEVDDYIEAIHASQEVVLPVSGSAYELPWQEHAAKFILANLNFGKIQLDDFKVIFGRDFMDCYASQVEEMLQRGWVTFSADKTALHVQQGQFPALYFCRALFYSTEALQWVESHMELCAV